MKKFTPFQVLPRGKKIGSLTQNQRSKTELEPRVWILIVEVCDTLDCKPIIETGAMFLAKSVDLLLQLNRLYSQLRFSFFFFHARTDVFLSEHNCV